MSNQATAAQTQSNGRLALTALAALGVVFGDIGTSPLYTLKTVLDYTGPHPDPAAVLGALSLILWTLFLITTVKYVNFAMRVDNDGEGGIIALMTLLGVKKHQRPIIISVGLFGAALIYGDGAITPAISVLSALEGVEQIAPALTAYVLPAATVILLALFAVQPFGTAAIGRAFGPIMLAWFLIIAALGVYGIMQHPAVFVAINPLYGLDYLMRGGAQGFLVLGGVFLCVTGAEALYADMGHFGPRPIQLCRPDGDRARGRADGRQHLLPALSGAAANAADRARDDRDGDRQPVHHHRCLFDDATGNPARLAAAHDHQADL
jgi:KUP system potassium uptake protein